MQTLAGYSLFLFSKHTNKLETKKENTAQSLDIQGVFSTPAKAECLVGPNIGEGGWQRSNTNTSRLPHYVPELGLGRNLYFQQYYSFSLQANTNMQPCCSAPRKINI